MRVPWLALAVGSLLSSTDYKVLPDYDRTTDDVIAQRQAWRDGIRLLLAS